MPEYQTVMDGVLAFFETENWPVVRLPNEDALRADFQGLNGRWSCFVQAQENHRRFALFSICPINVPENKRMEIAEYLTRVNQGLLIGNFDLDFADGQIRYKTGEFVEVGGPSYEVVKQLAMTNTLMMDEYLPGIMAVIYGSQSPEQALGSIRELLSA